MREQISTWQPIDSAPKDGTEILAYREDCGIFIARYTSCDAFCSEEEIEQMSEDDILKDDWFCADFLAGGRLEGSEVPTHWMPLPEEPLIPQDKSHANP